MSRTPGPTVGFPIPPLQATTRARPRGIAAAGQPIWCMARSRTCRTHSARLCPTAAAALLTAVFSSGEIRTRSSGDSHEPDSDGRLRPRTVLIASSTAA